MQAGEADLIVEAAAGVAGEQPGQRVEAADDWDRGQPDQAEGAPVSPVEPGGGEEQLAESAAAPQVARSSGRQRVRQATQPISSYKQSSAIVTQPSANRRAIALNVPAPRSSFGSHSGSNLDRADRLAG